MLLLNEYVDDKRLGRWLKTALDSSAKDPKVEAVKSEILFTYTQLGVSFIPFIMVNVCYRL